MSRRSEIFTKPQINDVRRLFFRNRNTLAKDLRVPNIPYHPWDWYIYLHEWLIFMVNVGKYTIHGLFGYVNWPLKKKKPLRGRSSFRVFFGTTKRTCRISMVGMLCSCEPRNTHEKTGGC